MFDDGNDVEPKHPTGGNDDVLAETIAKDVLEVVVEKTTKSKQKRKETGDASVFTFPPKKLREDYHAATSNIGGKSLATIRSLISEGSRSEVNSFAKSHVADALVMIVAVTTTIAVDVSVVPVSKDRVKSKNLENFRDSVSAGGANANVSSSPKLNEPATSSDSFYASKDLDSETLHRIYVPK
ncbi:hypothetical protein Tco_0863856 [Tanacetum coccineum]